MSIYLIGYFLLGFITASTNTRFYKRYSSKCDIPSMFVFVWVFWLPILLIGGFLLLLDWWLKFIGVIK